MAEWCFCCGRKLNSAELVGGVCEDCCAHVLPYGEEEWKRSYQSRVGEPCPFSTSGVFAERQPKDGDVVLACRHRGADRYHWMGFDGETIVRREDGWEFPAQWMMLCEQCFSACGDKPEGALARDFVWIGNDPAIRKCLM